MNSRQIAKIVPPEVHRERDDQSDQRTSTAQKVPDNAVLGLTRHAGDFSIYGRRTPTIFCVAYMF
jgi:hypothetical protein